MKQFTYLVLGLLFSCVLNAQVLDSIDMAGQLRTFEYYLPADASVPCRLIFVLHGTTQTGAEIADISLFHNATDEHTLVCYPDGINNVWNVALGFNAGIDDVSFLDALIDKFVAEQNVDPTRIFSCGFSAGGYMSYRLACQSEHCIAAVGSVAGTMMQAVSDSCMLNHPVSIMHMHGTSDFVVNYNGSSLSGYSADQVIDYWRNVNGCSTEVVSESIPNTNLTDLSTVEKFSYSNCQQNAEVVLFKITGGGHTWPDNNVLLGGVGATNRDINATQEFWNFFSNRSCAGPLGVNENEELSQSSLFYPNPTDGIVRHSLIEPENISIYNAYGQAVMSKPLRPGEVLDISQLPSGMYVVRSETHKEILIKM